MADGTLIFDTKLDSSGIEKGTSKIGKGFQQTGAKMQSMGVKATAAGAGLVLVGKKLLDATQVQQSAETKLTEIYKTRMGVDEQAAKSTMNLASQLQKTGVVGDEVALSGAQQLATYAKYPGTVDKLLPSMENLLVQQKGLNGTAEDATGIANLMGKAMMGQTGALKRVGISFDENQEKILKYGTEEEKAAMLSEVITQNVGNMNEEFAKTDAGKIQQAKNALGDCAEQLGAQLLPALGNIATWLSEKVLPKVQQFIDFMGNHPNIAKFAVALTAILVVGGPLLIFLGQLVMAVGALNLAFLANPITWIVIGIMALIAAVILLYNKCEWFRNAVNVALEFIKNLFITVVELIKARVMMWITIFTTLVAFFKSLPGKIKAAIGNLVGIATNWIKGFATAAISKITAFASALWAKAKALPGRIKSGIGSLVSMAASWINGLRTSAINKITATATALWNKAKALPKKIKNGLGSLYNIGRDFIAGLVNGIKDRWSNVTDWIESKISAIPQKIRDILGIASPSKVMAEIGKWIPIGMAEGIDDNLKYVEEAMLGMGKMTIGTAPTMTSAAGVSYLQASRAQNATVGAPIETVQTVEQTINFNQPVSTPAQTARVLREQAMYGLARA